MADNLKFETRGIGHCSVRMRLAFTLSTPRVFLCSEQVRNSEAGGHAPVKQARRGVSLCIPKGRSASGSPTRPSKGRWQSPDKGLGYYGSVRPSSQRKRACVSATHRKGYAASKDTALTNALNIMATTQLSGYSLG